MLNSARISAGGIIRKVGRFNMTILARINLSLTGSRFGQGESDNYTSSNRVKRKSQANFLCFLRLGLRRHLLTSTRLHYRRDVRRAKRTAREKVRIKLPVSVGA